MMEIAMRLPILLFMSFLLSQDAIDPQALEWFRKGEQMIGTALAYSAEQAECFEKAVQLQPDFAAARYNLALIYLRQEDLNRARPQLDALLEIDPEHLEGRLLRAELLLRADQPAAAAEDLEKILETTPEHLHSWQYMGQIRFRQGRFGEALQAFEQAESIDPQAEGIDLDMAVTLHNLGRLDEAVGRYRQHLAKSPEDFNAHVLLGNAYREKGDRTQTLQQFLKAAQLNPDDADLRTEIAYLYLHLGQLEEAEKWLQRQKTDQQQPENLAALGLIARRQNRMAEAESYFRQALEKEPGNADLWANLADLLYLRGDLAAAREAYEKAVALGLQDFEILHNLGNLNADLNDPAKAADFLRRALKLNPRSGAARFHLGLVLERLGDADKAFSEYLQALADGADDARLHFRLAVLFARRSSIEPALKHLDASLEKEAEKYLPIIDKELLNVRSDFDSIRYLPRFVEILKKHRARL